MPTRRALRPDLEARHRQPDAAAEIERTTVEIDASTAAHGQPARRRLRVRFDGFIAAYTDQKDDDAEDEENRRLPEIRSGEALAREKIVAPGSIRPSRRRAIRKRR
jgi:DNA topoisomerase IA